MGLKIINGDIFNELSTGNYDVILQGCNCYSMQKSGIAVEFVKRFQTNNFSKEKLEIDPISKLGNIDFEAKTLSFEKDGQEFSKIIYVINCYTQWYIGKQGTLEIPEWKPASVNALGLCLEKVKFYFKKYKIIMPLMGGGLGGLPKSEVIRQMSEIFSDVDATLVLYEQ